MKEVVKSDLFQAVALAEALPPLLQDGTCVPGSLPEMTQGLPSTRGCFANRRKFRSERHFLAAALGVQQPQLADWERR